MDIFVGSLPFKLKEPELKELFETYGEVTSAKIILDKETRQNKGFGFVEMPNDKEAEKAIEALNGSELSGRKIVVNKSEKRETRPAGSFGGGERRSTGFTPGGNTGSSSPAPSGDRSKGFSGNSSGFGQDKKPGSSFRGNDRDKSKGFGNEKKEKGGGFNKSTYKDLDDDKEFDY